MSATNTSDDPRSKSAVPEVLESYVPGSRVHAIVDNPTDIIIAEG